MPDWVDEGSRSTCRHCGLPIVWSYRPGKDAQVKRVGLYRASYAHWWHAPGKNYMLDPRGLAEDRYYGGSVETHSPFGPVFTACQDPEWLKLTREWRPPVHQAQPKDFCDERTENTSHCHRPIKDEELFMCGLHSRHHRERKMREQQEEIKRNVQGHIVSELGPIVDRLNDFWNLRAAMEYDTGLFGARERGYTGKVVVDAVRLMEILDEKVEEF